MSPPRDHVFGVDFSGSSSPGRKIWITEANLRGGSIQIVKCEPASDWFGRSASDRDSIYHDLIQLIESHLSAVFGFDFPFSLPKTVLKNVSSWRGHLENLDQLSGNKSAEEFRQSCVGRATVKPGASKYLRRETDWRYGGQCPYHHHLQHQTYHGQRNILAPLITGDDAVAIPMQDQSPTHPWMIEVYPAATLSKLGLYQQGYKNHTGSARRRSHNIDGLRDWGVMVSSPITQRCIDNDDAHDSLVAAVGTSCALQDDFPVDNACPDIEGQIFA